MMPDFVSEIESIQVVNTSIHIARFKSLCALEYT